MRKIRYLIILFLLVMFSQCKKESISDPAYAIGVIGFYEYGDNILNRAEINYSFYVNGKGYYNQYSNKVGGKKWKVPSSVNDYKKDDQYMVQYNADNPNSSTFGSRMLFDYKVNDSMDYKAYVKMFQSNPPN